MTPRHPTAFEARVYAMVRRIPKGQTRSYQWVAERLGNPALARAVGSALHRNPCLPARRHSRGGAGGRPRTLCFAKRSSGGRQADTTCTPCHRVIRADGTLGGYAGGVAKKRRLLRREGAPDPVNSV